MMLQVVLHLTVTRTLKLFRITGGSWGYVQDLTGTLI